MAFDKNTSGKLENEKIIHTKFLSEQMGALLTSGRYTDIVFKVEDEKFFAHKIILACRCEYFRALLFGGMRESNQDEIEIIDCTAEVFKIMLEYIYTGVITLSNLSHHVILDLLIKTREYDICDFEKMITQHLKQTFTVENCSMIYEVSRDYDLNFLHEEAISFIDRYGSEILDQEWFLDLSFDSLKSLIKRDSFFVPEPKIFDAVCRWIHANEHISMERRIKLLKYIRLPLTEMKRILRFRHRGGLSGNTILNACENFCQNWESECKHRGILIKQKNVATKTMGASLLTGEQDHQLSFLAIDGNISFLDKYVNGYASHIISDCRNKSGIVIKLRDQFLVNHIKMFLQDKNSRSYSYYVEISVDEKNWVKIIDHTEYFCRSWQHLSFPCCVAKYIRIVGTRSTYDESFQIARFEIMYAEEMPLLEVGIVVPKNNVATLGFGATEKEGFIGLWSDRNSFLSIPSRLGNLADLRANCAVFMANLADFRNTRPVGSGCVVIQLGQPYAVDSMRFKLPDLYQESYSYFVEVSVNMEEWEMLIDKRNERCTSWQTLHFNRRPVVFIRITDTENTTNAFYLERFECPARCRKHFSEYDDEDIDTFDLGLYENHEISDLL